MDTVNEGTLHDVGDKVFATELVVSKEPTYVNIHLRHATIKTELHYDGDMFCISACGGLPERLVAFGKTVNQACENFREACCDDSVKDFGKYRE